MAKNTGITFEKAIEEVFNMMYKNYPDAVVKHDVKLDSQYGKRQFDVVIFLKIPDDELITVIEGKDYNKKVDIKVVDGFHSKMRDVNASKGILISKMGFTSTARSKAKQLGITLYSLNQFSEFKEFDIKIPVLIEELFPLTFDILFDIERNSIEQPKIYFNKNEMIINNINISALVNDIWRNGSLEFDPDQNKQVLSIPGISAPYIYKFLVHESLDIVAEMEVKNLRLNLELARRYYICDIREVLKTNAIKNIEKGSIRFFADSASIGSAIKDLTRVTPTYAKEFTGVQYTIKITNTPEITFDPANLSIRPIV